MVGRGGVMGNQVQFIDDLGGVRGRARRLIARVHYEIMPDTRTPSSHARVVSTNKRHRRRYTRAGPMCISFSALFVSASQIGFSIRIL